MSDKLPERRQRRGEQELASFSKEATANFLAGGELGRPQWADPAEQRRQDEQRELLRNALQEMTPILARALHKHSSQAEASLVAHLSAALEGDVQSYKMYCAMLAELGKQALQP